MYNTFPHLELIKLIENVLNNVQNIILNEKRLCLSKFSFCLIEFIVQFDNFSLIWRRHHYR